MMSPAGSTRWCPTQQQLMMLKEMYRNGVRTPNATQIQQITSQLSLYGKIEGKNVFYWFQNHKARDRQKLRKKLSRQLQQQQQLYQQQQLLHYLGSPAASPNLFPQAGIHDEAAKQMMNYAWKFDVSDRVDKNKDMMRMYGGDLLMMVDVGPSSSSSPPCYPMISRPPLKTLELFPLTASDLKEECHEKIINTDCSNPVSCNITSSKIPLKPSLLPAGL